MKIQEIPPFTSPLETEYNEAIRRLEASTLNYPQAHAILGIMKLQGLIRDDFTILEMRECMEKYHKEKE